MNLIQEKVFKSLGIIFGWIFIVAGLFCSEHPAFAQTPIAKEYFTFHNLVRNGSFESFDQTQGLPAQWTITDASKVSLLNDPLQVKVGEVTVKLSGAVKFSQDIRDWKGLEGSTVTLGAWIKGSSGDSVKLFVDDGVSRQEKAVSLADTQWKYVTFKPTTALSGSAKYLKVELEVVSTATGISLDGVMLTQVSKGVVFVPNPDDQERSPQDLIYTDGVSGNVGIGTNTPQTALDVLGDIRASGKVYQGESEQQEELLTKTAADELYLNNDQDETLTKNLTVDGSLTSSTGKVLNDLEVAGLVKAGRFEGNGSGLTNILGQWKSSVDGTGIYFDQGNVGIGTKEPGANLEISGVENPRIKLTNFLDPNYQVSLQANGDSGHQFSLTSANNVEILGEWGLNVKLSARGDGDLIFQPNQTPQVVFKSGGNVGIGTTDPRKKLDVNGSLRSYNLEPTGTSYIYTGAVKLLDTYPYDLGGISSYYVDSAWNSATVALLGPALDGVSSPLEYITLKSDGTDRITSINGNVGIGITNPIKKLQVAGEILLSGYPTGLYLGNSQGFYDNGNSGLNIFSGANIDISSSGNISLTGGNVGIGTSTPSEKLEVNGNIKATGNLTIAGTLDAATLTQSQRPVLTKSEAEATYLNQTSAQDTYVTRENAQINDLNVYGEATMGSLSVPGISTSVIRNSGTGTDLDIYSLYRMRFKVGDPGSEKTKIVLSNMGEVGINTEPVPYATLSLLGRSSESYNAYDTAGLLIQPYENINNGDTLLKLGVNHTIGQGWIRVEKYGATEGDLVLQPEGGNVGIGTPGINPDYKLQVAGQINATDFLKNGTPLVAWGATGSDIYYNSGNVGIGTVNPREILDIYKDTDGFTGIDITNPNTGINSSEGIYFNNEDGTIAGIRLFDEGNANYPSRMTIFNNRPNGSIVFTTSGQGVIIKDNGNVGINETNPRYTLDVAGIVNATDIYKNGSPFSPNVTAANVSAGTFGSSVGGGSYSFPSNVSVSGQGSFSGTLFAAGNVQADGIIFSGGGYSNGGSQMESGTLFAAGKVQADDTIFSGGGSSNGGSQIQSNGNIYAAGAIFSGGGYSNGGSQMQSDGYIYAAGGIRTADIKVTSGSDIAEPFQMSDLEGILEGVLVVIDPENPGKLKISTQAYDHCVAGIISGAGGIHPGITLSQEELLGGGKNVTISGRVYVFASASNGAIKPGDLLTTSDIPGHAMKVTDKDRANGAVIGKAMTILEEGKGLVLVLVNLQ